jgi:hypothetical protein
MRRVPQRRSVSIASLTSALWLNTRSIASPMASRRSNIKRTIAPALVLMALVFVLSYHLPSSGSQEESRDLDTSARAQLEKELAIHKPRTRITVSAEHGRSVQMLHGQEVPKDSESRRPLERALYAYLEAYRTTARAGKRVATESKVLVYIPGVVGWGNRVQGYAADQDSAKFPPGAWRQKKKDTATQSPTRLQNWLSLQAHASH